MLTGRRNNMNKQYFISICIPSYNRPKELARLLESIDTKQVSKVQIVICEDKAPQRLEVRGVVEAYSRHSKFNVKYIENSENFGHGKNLRECIKQADGEYVLFMGDDDMFIPEEFDEYFVFLSNHSECGYILRSSRQLVSNGKYEYFRYYPNDRVFSPGIESYTQLFLKSVFMSGFTIKRDLVVEYFIDSLDDTLLFQLYLMAEVCMKHASAYYNTPFVQGVGDGISYFGVNDKEKGLYTPGVLVTNNRNFIDGFLKITNYVDKKYNINSTEIIKTEMSKYSYSFMWVARSMGRKKFKEHCQGLREMGLDNTHYFDIYYYGLYIFGETITKNMILLIKKVLGRRVIL